MLAGCGLHPMYGGDKSSTGDKKDNTDVAIENELASVQVDTIADRQGQMLRNDLIDQLQADGVPPPAKYELMVTYSESQADLGINNNATSTRGQLTLTASYEVKDKVTGVRETSGSLQQITGYNIQYSEFSTIVSRDDAERRALQGTAENIRTRLAFFFENKLYHPDRLKKNPAKAPDPSSIIPPNPLNNPNTFSNSSPITQSQ
jgi:LPS-assembly lipoprotein